MAETILAKMAVQISANAAELTKALNKSSSDMKSFQQNVVSVASAVGVAFGVKEVGEFAFEVAKLAGEAEGVRNAFDRLPNSTRLMMDLQNATHGTVGELDLMKRTVQASNFGISLEALPKLLEFAALRAQQTGQSVDYLVDSIVTGIGRKSTLILDNLGISAVQLKSKLGGVSSEAATIGQVADAVGKIAEESLKGMGEFSDNTKTKVDRLSASWENYKIAVGNAANSSGILGTAIEGLSASLDVAASNNLSFTDKLLAFAGGAMGIAGAKIDDYIEKVKKSNEEQKKQEQIIKEVDRAFAEFNGNIEAYGKAIEQHIYKTELLEEFKKRLIKEEAIHVETLGTLKAKLDELNGQFETTDTNDKKKLANIGEEIIAIQAQIEKLEELRKKREEVGQLQTTFGKEQASNAAQGKETTFTDLSSTTAPENQGTEDSVMLSDGMFPDITDKMDTYVENIERGKTSLAEWGEQMTILNEQQEAAFERSKESALQWGDAIGSAVAQSIQGQESAAQSLKRLTSTIVQQFLRQALGAIIASATKSGGPPPVAIALAAAGVAAVSAMFSKIGASGGSSAASAGGTASRSVTQAERFTSADGQRVELSGQVFFDGRQLQLALEHSNNRTSRTGA